MTNQETARDLDPQLTHCLTMSNGLLYGDVFGDTEMNLVRVYLGMAIGMTSGFAPTHGAQTAFSYAEALAAATTVEELITIQQAIFNSAYAVLNAALYS